MKEIQYQIDEIGVVSTPCPFQQEVQSMQPFIRGTPNVGSSLCRECAYYEGHGFSLGMKTILCSNPNKQTVDISPLKIEDYDGI